MVFTLTRAHWHTGSRRQRCSTQRERLHLFQACVNTNTWQHDVHSGGRREMVVTATHTQLSEGLTRDRWRTNGTRTYNRCGCMWHYCMTSWVLSHWEQHPLAASESLMQSVCIGSFDSHVDWPPEESWVCDLMIVRSGTAICKPAAKHGNHRNSKFVCDNLDSNAVIKHFLVDLNYMSLN